MRPPQCTAFAVAAAVSAALLPAAATSSPPPPLLPFRPPAVPLFVTSPFASFWSAADALAAADTENWSGAPARLSGLLRVDGAAFRWLGGAPAALPAAPQLGFAAVSATRTRASFAVGGVALNVSFSSPRVLDDADRDAGLALFASPASFVDIALASLDGAAHAVELYFDADATLLTNESSDTTPVTWARVNLDGEAAAVSAAPSLLALRFGADAQRPLDPVVCGQSVPLTGSQTIVWGYAYLVTYGANASGAAASSGFVGRTETSRASFAASGALPPTDDAPPLSVGDGAPGAALAWSVSLSAAAPASVRATFFFDEILAASYYADVPAWAGHPAAGTFAPLWRRDLPFNDTVGVPAAAIAAAHAGAAASIARADAFDAELFSQLAASGGEALATFGSLVYRQVVGAFAPVWHVARGEIFAFFKEMGSGGDFSTTDVIYPASPIFAARAPALLRAILLPLMIASGNESTTKESYFKHDLGKFPIANSIGAGEAMPLEETANVVHMLAAIALREGGNVTWLAPFFAEPAALPRWRDFMYSSLPIVPTQGTTDDFLGVVHNSTNLGVKGAVGLAAYGILAWMAGNATEAGEAWEYAAYSSAVNLRNGFFVDSVAAGGANRSHFCWGWGYCAAGGGGAAPPNSTFLLYNLLYGRMLRMRNLIPLQEEVIAQQMAYYELAIEGPFGIPLMNGSTGAMPEWQSFFSASLIPPGGPAPPSSMRVFGTFLGAANATAFRAPMTDYYDSRTAWYGGKYRARPVLGGVWAAAAVTVFDALPPFPHEAPMAAAFERGHAREAQAHAKARAP